MPGGRKLPEPLVLAFLMAAPGPRPPAPFIHRPDTDAGSLAWHLNPRCAQDGRPHKPSSALCFLSCNVSFYIWLPNSYCSTVKN